MPCQPGNTPSQSEWKRGGAAVADSREESRPQLYSGTKLVIELGGAERKENDCLLNGAIRPGEGSRRQSGFVSTSHGHGRVNTGYTPNSGLSLLDPPPGFSDSGQETGHFQRFGFTRVSKPRRCTPCHSEQLTWL